MTHLYKFLIPDSSKNSTFILKNSANNSIFDSTSIFQFCDSASTRLRLQSFAIRLDDEPDEPRVGTPLRRYLVSSSRLEVGPLGQNRTAE